MRAAIYNPYFDTLGGGERYTIMFAKALANLGYKVDVQWSETIRKRLENHFGIDLSEINFVKDIKRGDGYDVCFWLSDGSIPLLHARKNFLHFQFPFRNVSGKSLLNRMKLFRINKVICNSGFTKSFIDSEYQVNSFVLYPPVSVNLIKPKRKENIILFVGRFSQLTQSKNQHILVDAFKDLCSRGVHNWKLILAGGVEVGIDNYFEKLSKSIKGYPIEIIKSPNFKELVSLYGKAKIFWSAVGFGADETLEPMKVEHFGISVVEAMAGGAVPIVYNAGGYKETVEDGISGYLWNKKSILVKKTLELINKKVFSVISEKAILASKKYGYEKFEKEIQKFI